MGTAPAATTPGQHHLIRCSGRENTPTPRRNTHCPGGSARVVWRILTGNPSLVTG